MPERPFMITIKIKNQKYRMFCKYFVCQGFFLEIDGHNDKKRKLCAAQCVLLVYRLSIKQAAAAAAAVEEGSCCCCCSSFFNAAANLTQLLFLLKCCRKFSLLAAAVFFIMMEICSCSLDKPARLTIRFLWFLFRITICQIRS